MEHVISRQHGAQRATIRYGSALIISLLAACAGALSGCGQSVNSEFELTQTEQKAGSGVMAISAQGVEPVRVPVSASSLTTVGTPGSTGYKIGPADVLDISVFKVPELARTVQVDDGGTINLP